MNEAEVDSEVAGLVLSFLRCRLAHVLRRNKILNVSWHRASVGYVNIKTNQKLLTFIYNLQNTVEWQLYKARHCARVLIQITDKIKKRRLRRSVESYSESRSEFSCFCCNI